MSYFQSIIEPFLRDLAKSVGSYVNGFSRFFYGLEWLIGVNISELFHGFFLGEFYCFMYVKPTISLKMT